MSHILRKSFFLLLLFFFSSCLKSKSSARLLYSLPISSGSNSILVTIGAETLALAEGGNSVTYTISIDKAPSSEILINAQADSQLLLNNNSSASLSFTAENWSNAQIISVQAVDDTLLEGNHESIISHTVSMGGNTIYNLSKSEIIVSITDNDDYGLTVTETGGSTDVSESGNTDSYSIVLNKAPSSDVNLSFVVDSQLNSISSLTFTPSNWNQPQTITVSAVDDSLREYAHTSIINHSVSSSDPYYNNISVSSVTVNITDNDTPGITIVESGGSTSVTEGSTTDTYTLVLNTQPANDVTISFTTDARITVISNVVFTTANWNSPQTITVIPVDDSVYRGTISSTISHASSSVDTDYNNISIANISVSITDNDTPGITIVESGGSTSVTEGSTTDTYTLVLNTQPANDVTISFTTDARITAISNVVFTTANWNSPQTITVSPVNDSVYRGTISSTISHSLSSTDSGYNGISVSNVSVSITDNDTPGVTVTQTGSETSVMEGFGTDSINYVLNSEPMQDVSLSLSFDTSQIKLNGSTSSPLVLTFAAANWNVAQAVTVEAVADGVIEPATHTSSITYSSSSSDSFYNSLTITATTINIIEDHGTHLVGSFQTGSRNISSSNTTITLGTSVNPLTSFVYCNFQYTGSANSNAATCQLNTAGTSVEIKTGGGTGVKANYYVVEFDSGTIVQRGVSSFASGDLSKTINLSSTIDLSRTMVITYGRTSDSATNTDERRYTRAILTNSNTLSLNRDESGSTVDVEYQVIMMSSSSVQSGQVTLSNGTSSTTASLSSAVDLTKSFLVFNYTGAGSINGVEYNLYTRGRYSNSTTLQFDRTGTTGNISISYFAITLNAGVQSMQHGTTAVNNVTSSVNQAITSVNLTKSMVIISNDTTQGDAAATTQDSGTYWVDDTSTNSQLTFSKNNSEGATATINWTVLEFQ
ncbi:MAG: hypothetical protein H7A25_19665 [Leptospiraceae bacterium]|nr:hypothetical protein [Leptospiraceae bacterium]